MLKGLGVDIIEIGRIKQAVEQSGKSFLDRIFTPNELAYCNGKHNRYQHLAARFAAKEAVGKALSTGVGGEFGWKDIEVLNDELGKPHIALHGALQDRLGHSAILLSISHSGDHVVAVAAIEERGTR
jgi:holo-[acyl-carrier protein] synthase